MTATGEKSNVFITVAIASYNYEQFILRMLESVARQDFRDFEIVVTDDGSTDRSVEVIRKFMADHPELSVRLFENEHLGLASNRNASLDAARGEYIMFCDADDSIEEDCLSSLADAALKSHPDRVCSYVRDVDSQGKELQIEEQWGELPSRWMCNLHHGSLYRRSLFYDHGIRFTEAKGGDDFLISTVYNSFAKTIEFVPKPLYNWVVRSDSTSGAKKTITDYTGIHMIEPIVSSMQEVRERIRSSKEDLDLFTYQLTRYYYFCIFHCYRYVPLSDTFRDYGEMRKMMKEMAPDYLKNRYITLKRPSPARTYAKRIIFFSALFEKLHVFKAALVLYHLASKIVFFNT